MSEQRGGKRDKSGGDHKLVIEAIQYLQEVAKSPGEKEFKVFRKYSNTLLRIRKLMHVVPDSHKPTEPKETKERKSDKSQPVREIEPKELRSQQKRKELTPIQTPVKKPSKKTMSPSPDASNYCIDCCFPLESEFNSWENQRQNKAAIQKGRGQQYGQVHQQMEDYLSYITKLYGPRSVIPHGLHQTQLYLPQRARMLGQLSSDLVPQSPFERWSPHEIALFEAAISVYGKVFHRISEVLHTKNTGEVIEFYYSWKFSSHYYAWKTHFRSPDKEIPRGG